jgi:hypothetical protein
METPRICLIHIPKTAGTSITSVIAKSFKREDICPGRTMLDYKDKGEEELAKYKFYKGHIYYEFAIEKLPKDTKFVTVLREPVERVISLYKFWRSHPQNFFEDPSIPDIIKHGPRMAKDLDFLHFVKSEDNFVVQSTRNAQLRQLSRKSIGARALNQNRKNLNEVMEEIQNYAVVGIQELLPFFAVEYNAYIGVKVIDNIPSKNMSKKEEQFKDLTPPQLREAKNILIEENQMEMELYERVRSLVMQRASEWMSNYLLKGDVKMT